MLGLMRLPPHLSSDSSTFLNTTVSLHRTILADPEKSGNEQLRWWQFLPVPKTGRGLLATYVDKGGRRV